jgi:hypothetical protein
MTRHQVICRSIRVRPATEMNSAVLISRLVVLAASNRLRRREVHSRSKVKCRIGRGYQVRSFLDRYQSSQTARDVTSSKKATDMQLQNSADRHGAAARRHRAEEHSKFAGCNKRWRESNSTLLAACTTRISILVHERGRLSAIQNDDFALVRDMTCDSRCLRTTKSNA